MVFHIFSCSESHLYVSVYTRLCNKELHCTYRTIIDPYFDILFGISTLMYIFILSIDTFKVSNSRCQSSCVDRSPLTSPACRGVSSAVLLSLAHAPPCACVCATGPHGGLGAAIFVHNKEILLVYISVNFLEYSIFYVHNIMFISHQPIELSTDIIISTLSVISIYLM